MHSLQPTKALSHALKSTFDNLGFAFHISWPWMALILPLNIITTLYMVFNGLQLDPTGEPNLAKISDILAVSFPLTVASIIAYASIAVSWHRYVLLDEVPQGWDRLRIDAVTWRYIGNVFIVFAIFFVLVLASMLAGALLSLLVATIIGETVARFVFLIVYGGGFVFAFVSLYRVSVKLPAVALGRSDFKVGDAWRVTDGNFWRLLSLLVAMLACLLLLGVLMFAASAIFTNFGTVGLAISIAIQVMVNWAATIFGVTLLTSLYGFFVENRDF